MHIPNDFRSRNNFLSYASDVFGSIVVVAKHVRMDDSWNEWDRKGKNEFHTYFNAGKVKESSLKRTDITIEWDDAKLFSFQIDNKLLNDLNGKISKPYRHYDHKNLFIVFFTCIKCAPLSLSLSWPHSMRGIFMSSPSLLSSFVELNVQRKRNRNIDEWSPHPSLNLILYATS